MSDKRDYYEVLGVARDVEAGDLKRAYRRLAMELHPDRNPGDAVAEDRFKEASEAYQVLSEPGKPRVGQLVDPDRVRAAVEELLE